MLFVVLVGQFSHLRLRFAEPTSELGHDLPSTMRSGRKSLGLALRTAEHSRRRQPLLMAGFVFHFRVSRRSNP